MKKITKTYVEKIYKGDILTQSSIEEIDDRNPMKVENDGKIQGFRFYDKEYILDGEKIYKGIKTNYSGFIYYGKRYSLDKFIEEYGDNPDYNFLIRKMKSNDYNYVCQTQNDAFIPMREVDITLDEYEEKLESTANKMFEKLKEHIGEDVTYTAWCYGRKIKATGELKKIIEFGNVEIGSAGIPFVGHGFAISEIKSKDEEILYSNPNIEYGYNRKSDEEVNASKRLIYGNRIVDNMIKKTEELKRKFDTPKSKYYLMKEGLNLVIPDTIEDWLEFVDNNTNDNDSINVVKATISMMKKFEEGISFKEAEKIVYNEEFGLTAFGFLAETTANALSYFAKQGEEYRIYWNRKNGIEDPKENVNPAIITTRKH